MTRRYIHPDQEKKQESEAKPAPDPITTDHSIDDLLKRGIEDIYGIMRAIRVDVSTGAPSRETIMNLKDVMSMLHELKKKEADLLDSLSDTQLEEYLNKRK